MKHSDRCKKIIDRLPKNTWVAYKVQDFQWSVVHTSDTHGLFSMGWEGSTKITPIEFHEGEKYRAIDLKKIQILCEGLATQLNILFPNGIPNPEEDEEYYEDLEE